ncbi:MAG: hypothetical protein AAF632_28990 [Bacteroidota bacterium]
MPTTIARPSACLLKSAAGVIKNLMAFRDRLTKSRVSLTQIIADLRDMDFLVDNSFIIKQAEEQLQLVEQQIKNTDKQMEETLQADVKVQNHSAAAA